MVRPGPRSAGLLTAALCAAALAAAAPTAERPPIVLLTLDTTRDDCVGGAGSGTPNLERLAARGTRFARALSPAPLTLPAHSSLLTGLDPPRHGVRDNGVGALPGDLPTLATVLRARGYSTAAFVSSRVLDRRFGLHRGFETYDDRMTAEQTGEQGYPERDAAAVTESALRWLAGRRSPYFLWVHYYDPHAPYVAPGSDAAAPPGTRYRDEIRHVDAQVGRLLAGLPGPVERTIVAAVGDHGEMLGEHGERDHGVFLYRGSLDVPLILGGPGVPRGRRVEKTVPTRALAATLLRLSGLEDTTAFGDALPGLGLPSPAEAAVYSETFLPATAYGWSPLKAVTLDQLRYVEAPRPELYDLAADSGESHNLASERPAEVARLRARLQQLDGAGPTREAAAVAPDAAVAEALRSLGYLSGASAPLTVARTGGMDPKDGMPLLSEFERAKALLAAGRVAEARALFEDLVRRSPGNVPFLSRLAEAEAASGRREAALATLRAALQLNPSLDFLRLRLADGCFELGRLGEARAEYAATLAKDPRSARAWMGLGEVALRQGRPEEELSLMRRAVAAGAQSAAVLSRLSQIEAGRGDLAAAEAHAEEAVGLLPDSGPAWWVWGEAAEKSGRPAEAAKRFARAVEEGFETRPALLHLGWLLDGLGRTAEARVYLEQANRLLESPR